MKKLIVGPGVSPALESPEAQPNVADVLDRLGKLQDGQQGRPTQFVSLHYETAEYRLALATAPGGTRAVVRALTDELPVVFAVAIDPDKHFTIREFNIGAAAAVNILNEFIPLVEERAKTTRTPKE